MTKHKQSFWEWNNIILINSLKKINLNIILIIILDLLFYISSGYLIILWLQRIQAKLALFNLPSDVASLGYEKAQQVLAETKSFYYLLIFSFVLLIIAVIFLASILKGIIWAKTTDTKVSFALISKFLGLNIIWMGFWLLLMLLIAYFIQIQLVSIFMTAAMILGIYFTNTLYTIFMKGQKFEAILAAIKLNITKIHLFLVPYIILFLLLFIIRSLFKLLQFEYLAVIAGIIVVIYAAVARYYTSNLVLEIEKI